MSIEPLSNDELEDCEAALAESPSLDGQRWHGVWSDLIERLVVTVRNLQGECFDYGLALGAAEQRIAELEASPALPREPQT